MPVDAHDQREFAGVAEGAAPVKLAVEVAAVAVAAVSKADPKQDQKVE